MMPCPAHAGPSAPNRGRIEKAGYRNGLYTTARNILEEAGYHPAPDKAGGKPLQPWTTLVYALMENSFCGSHIGKAEARDIESF